MHKYLLHGLVVATVVSTVTAGYLGYQLWQQDAALAKNESLLLAYSDYSLNELGVKEDTIEDLASRLELTESELEETEDNLRGERERNDAMEEQVTELAGTVSDLDKLSKTDKELLQKYSKVYFLNEHYIPESIREIDAEWKYTESKANQLHSKVMPFFEDMLEDAKADGVNLWVVSAYRSFYQQAELKGAYTITYGSGANAFSADQGFSEHQLGTTVDFTTSGIGGGLDGFQATAAYQWLLDNAHKYGFAMSYPPNNAYYVFEPWHWRFVGEELATDLHNAGAYFYDWEQRKIDGYLLNIFD